MIKKFFTSINYWIKSNQKIVTGGICGLIIGCCVGLKMELVIISTLLLHLMWSSD